MVNKVHRGSQSHPFSVTPPRSIALADLDLFILSRFDKWRPRGALSPRDEGPGDWRPHSSGARGAHGAALSPAESGAFCVSKGPSCRRPLYTVLQANPRARPERRAPPLTPPAPLCLGPTPGEPPPQSAHAGGRGPRGALRGRVCPASLVARAARGRGCCSWRVARAATHVAPSARRVCRERVRPLPAHGDSATPAPASSSEQRPGQGAATVLLPW